MGKLKLDMHNFQNTQYSAHLGIGHPSQDFKVIFDTGSANAWVYEEKCTTIACSKHKRFDGTKSSTYKGTPETLSITYGSGTVSGIVGQDTLTVGDKHVPGVKFGLIQNTRAPNEVFEMGSFDGVVGLGFSRLAINGITPVFDALHDAHFKDKPKMFSIFMDKTPGSTLSALYFGGVDSTKASGDWTFHTVDGTHGYWWVKLTSVKVGDEVLSICQGSCKAAIDTGTSIITGPKTDVDVISNKIVDKINPDCSNAYD